MLRHSFYSEQITEQRAKGSVTLWLIYKNKSEEADSVRVKQLKLWVCEVERERERHIDHLCGKPK